MIHFEIKLEKIKSQTFQSTTKKASLYPDPITPIANIFDANSRHSEKK